MSQKAITAMLVAGMLATGVANTLLTKYQDMQCVRNCDSPDPSQRHVFEQPVLQTLQMFIGEMGCWLIVGGFSLRAAFKNRRLAEDGYEPVGPDDEQEGRRSTDSTNPALAALMPNAPTRTPMRGWNVFLLALPACCDIAGTTLMNVGLLFTAASIYQMTRGALVLFVALFSIMFLKRVLHLFQWVALFSVVLGVGIVGLAGAIFKDPAPEDRIKSNEIFTENVTGMTPVLRTVVGVLLIAGAQIFTATQFVLEEWILENYALEPLKIVGWEGVFGTIVTSMGMVILHFTVGNTPSGKYGFFDAAEGFHQMFSHKVVLYTSLAIMVSIGGFNFFGISVTRTISSTARSIIDTCRTLFIWIVSLALHWESFKWLQIVGFALLVYGTFLFNDLVNPPLAVCYRRKDVVETPAHREEREELLPEHPVEHV